jgi:hypothetical protein
MKRLLILSIVVVLVSSCNLFKGGENNKEEVMPVAKIDDFNKYRENDNYSIVNAFVEGDILNLDVTYNGGCKAHNFELIGSNMVAKSLPPQRNVLLVHHANGDDCRELMGERIKFNIQNLAFDGKDIMLRINGYENEVLYQVQ